MGDTSEVYKIKYQGIKNYKLIYYTGEILNIRNRRLGNENYDSNKHIIEWDNIEDEKIHRGKKGFNEELGIEELDIVPKNIVKKILTEDLGIIFEKAICLSVNIVYDGDFKYDIIRATTLSNKIINMIKIFPELNNICKHTAKNGSRYDFITINNNNLSAKTNKNKGGKVAPQVIGQSSLKKFCIILNEHGLKISFTNIDNLKVFISNNIYEILPILINYTFDCPNLYYNEEEDIIKYIKMKHNIEWDKSKISFTGIIEDGMWYTMRKGKKEVVKSKTFKYDDKSILEIQIHDKNRKNMAIRWYYENLLYIFKDNFDIVSQ